MTSINRPAGTLRSGTTERVIRCWATTLLVFAMTAPAVSCGSDSGTGPSVSYAGEANDQVGDNAPHAGFATTPDITRVLAEVNGDRIKFVAEFAAGSLDLLSEITFAFDTDENAATGVQNSAYDGLGVEYFLKLGPDHDVTLTDYNGGNFVDIATGAVLVRSATHLEVEFRLELLGSDDGRLRFKTASALTLGPGTSTTIIDFAPEDAAAPVAVR